VSLTINSLGDLLTRTYATTYITKALNSAMPVYTMLRQRQDVKLTEEWTVHYQVHSNGEIVHRWIHFCPTGDVRAVLGKTCHLCQAVVPEAVEFMARCLEEEWG